MKVVFLCGSLEQGRDGVGDYVRRLSEELIRQGHQVAAAALNDKFAPETIEENQQVENSYFPILRITSCWPQRKRFGWAHKWIVDQNPDWISLQFVPFSFHPKGLSFGLGSKFKNLTRGFKFHVMFHELWVNTKSGNLKMRVLGRLQKLLIKKLISKCNPNCITTTIAYYQTMLNGFGVTTLPLFGNIPFVAAMDNKDGLNDKLKVVHFGSFSGELEQLELQLNYLYNAANFYNRKIEFVALGEGGIFKEKAIPLAKKIIGKDAVKELGRLNVDEVSAFFQKSDIGISRADYSLAGKSGSSLAMLEHGLPVVLRGKSPINEKKDKWTHPYTEQLVFIDSDYSKVMGKRQASSRLGETAKEFIKLLNHQELVIN